MLRLLPPPFASPPRPRFRLLRSRSRPAFYNMIDNNTIIIIILIIIIVIIIIMMIMII